MEAPGAALETAALLQLLGKLVQIGIAAGVEQSEQTHAKIPQVGVGQIRAVNLACGTRELVRRQWARGRKYQCRGDYRTRGPAMNDFHEAPSVHARWPQHNIHRMQSHESATWFSSRPALNALKSRSAAKPRKSPAPRRWTN